MKPKTVREYIDAAPKEARRRLREMRAILRKAAPGAQESLKWSMPSLSYKRILFSYAAFTKHVSLFPTPSAIKAFASDLAKYRISRGTIQFPLDEPLPARLVHRIAAFRVRESLGKDARWM